MEQRLLADVLRSNVYPGRGIVAGKSEDGRFAVMAYFIMGRSANSRNRVFVTDGDGIRTRAFDESKMVDPSLIIYSPVRVLGSSTIVTNGDQTDTAYEGLKKGLTFEQALSAREFEPDAPNYTPRISALFSFAKGGFSYALHILKSDCGDPSSPLQFLFRYTAPKNGTGHFIHTYAGDGNPLPSFEGEPEKVLIRGGIDDFTAETWDSLNHDNRISLFVRFVELAGGKTETRIVNGNS
jgi:IMP cyclohydrolase